MTGAAQQKETEIIVRGGKRLHKWTCKECAKAGIEKTGYSAAPNREFCEDHLNEGRGIYTHTCKTTTCGKSFASGTRLREYCNECLKSIRSEKSMATRQQRQREKVDRLALEAAEAAAKETPQEEVDCEGRKLMRPRLKPGPTVSLGRMFDYAAPATSKYGGFSPESWGGARCISMWLELDRDIIAEEIGIRRAVPELKPMPDDLPNFAELMAQESEAA